MSGDKVYKVRLKDSDQFAYCSEDLGYKDFECWVNGGEETIFTRFSEARRIAVTNPLPAEVLEFTLSNPRVVGGDE